MRYIKSLELNYIWTFLNVVRCKDEECPDPPYYCGRNCQGKTLVYYQKNRTRKFNLLLLIHRDLFFFLSRGIFCDSLPCRPVKSIICNGKCDRLWQKQAFGLKISFVHFSLEQINNNFWLKCCKHCYSTFMGSRDMNFVMLFYSEVQFQEKLAKFVDINRNPWQCMCIQP